MNYLYSQRMNGIPPKVNEKMSYEAKDAFFALIISYQNKDFLGIDYPNSCEDDNSPYGTNDRLLKIARNSALPEFETWPQKIKTSQFSSPDSEISTMDVLDILEWHAEHVGKPENQDYHKFFKHYHKRWNRKEGLELFQKDVNQTFNRHGLAYEMDTKGHINRTVESVGAEKLKNRVFNSGDSVTDDLLEKARSCFFNRDPNTIQQGLEHLWDAFERLKTHDDSVNKKKSIEILLDRISSSPDEREILNKDMNELTKIGNEYRIRHHEKNKKELNKGLREYFFMKMFCFIDRIIPKN